MARPTERFKTVFSGLKIIDGKIIALVNQDVPLTQNVSVVDIDSYLGRLEKFIL